MIVARRQHIAAVSGHHVYLHTVTHTKDILFPKVYSRWVRRPYTGAELREMRKLRGVGQVRRISKGA